MKNSGAGVREGAPEGARWPGRGARLGPPNGRDKSKNAIAVAPSARRAGVLRMVPSASAFGWRKRSKEWGSGWQPSALHSGGDPEAMTSASPMRQLRPRRDGR
jgi:hypothetical protein